MARPREPVNLILAKGKKHLTREEIEDRLSAEVKAPADKVKAPSYLSPKLKREFTKLAKQLMDIGIMTNLDVDALARFVISRAIYIELSAKILKAPALLISDEYPQIAINFDRAFKQCSSAARDLGLTISSRCNLVLPEAVERPKTRWDEIVEKRMQGGGRG